MGDDGEDSSDDDWASARRKMKSISAKNNQNQNKKGSATLTSGAHKPLAVWGSLEYQQTQKEEEQLKEKKKREGNLKTPKKVEYTRPGASDSDSEDLEEEEGEEKKVSTIVP